MGERSYDVMKDLHARAINEPDVLQKSFILRFCKHYFN